MFAYYLNNMYHMCFCLFLLGMQRQPIHHIKLT
jgi:hypothetical protein